MHCTNKHISATVARGRLLEDLKKSTLIAKYKKLAKQGAANDLWLDNMLDRF